MFSVVFLERTLLCQSTQIQENPQTSFSSPIFFLVKASTKNHQTVRHRYIFWAWAVLTGCQTIIPSRLHNKVPLNFAKTIALLK